MNRHIIRKETKNEYT